uniref:Uncharacterized protein n=1 Tax=Oryza barthii TaxID=65489 RepID=A0A0D3FCL0_9ORYZ
MLHTGIPSGRDPSSCLPIQREARAERLSCGDRCRLSVRTFGVVGEEDPLGERRTRPPATSPAQ